MPNGHKMALGVPKAYGQGNQLAPPGLKKSQLPPGALKPGIPKVVNKPAAEAKKKAPPPKGGGGTKKSPGKLQHGKELHA
jgi:hypothetical protein